jgi:hypothetical protein
MKLLVCVIISFLLSLSLVSPAPAAPKVIVDGKQLSFDVPPVIQDGRVLVPMRAIFESLGAELQWDGVTRTVAATKGELAVVLTVDVRTASKNGAVVAMDVPPRINGGRTLVPLRFVTEALGIPVYWNGTTQTVSVFSETQSVFSTTYSEQDTEPVSLFPVVLPGYRFGYIDNIGKAVIESVYSCNKGFLTGWPRLVSAGKWATLIQPEM